MFGGCGTFGVTGNRADHGQSDRGASCRNLAKGFGQDDGLIRSNVLLCHGNAYVTPLPSGGEEQCTSQSNPQLVKSRGKWFHPHMMEN